jgi:hypothetical protein
MDETLLEGSISKARELQDAIERGKVIQFDLLKRQEQEWSLDEVRQRRADTERALQNFERAIKNREEDLERRISEYVDATKERQARELEDFVKYWQSEAVRRRYNRTSGELRNLRKQERLLFALRRLNDAEQVNKIAAQREKMEIDSAYRTMLKDYAESRQRIEERHEAELSVVEEVARRKKQEFECLVARLMRPWTARLKKLDIEEENTQDRDRLWNRKHHYDGNPIDQCLGVESWQPPALPRLPTPQ